MPQKMSNTTKFRENIENLFDFLPGMAYRCMNDHAWTMRFVSAGSLELTGYTTDEFENQKIDFGSLILPGFSDYVWTSVQKAVFAGKPYALEYKIKTRSGAQKWVWEKGKGVFSGSGELLFLEGFIIDITERKEKEIILDTFFDIVPDFLNVCTTDSKFVRVNKAVKNLLGYNPEEMIGQSYHKFIHPDDLVPIRAYKYKLGPENVNFFRNRYIAKDGRIVHFEWVSSIQDGMVYSSARDITERVALEKALTENEKLMRSMINSITESVFLMDLEGKVVICNEVCALRYNKTPEELVGHSIFDLLSPDLSVSRRAKVKQIFETREPAVFEDSRDGKTFLSSIYPVFGDDNSVIQFAVFGYDITERKESITKLEALTAELTELNQSKNRFISVLAHDLRSPFHPLLNTLDILDTEFETLSKEEKTRFIKSAKNTATSVFGLLESLLTWIMATQDTSLPDLKNLNITEIIQKACEQVIEQAKAKKVTLSLRVDTKPDKNSNGKSIRENSFSAKDNAKSTDDNTFSAGENHNINALVDYDMLLTVLRNLLSNSIKFCQTGGEVVIKVFSTDDATHIEISDNGIGMSQSQLNSLFQISETGSTPGTQNEKGAGFGLLLCKALVNKMNGNITVDSTVGIGTSVTLSFKKA
ncbi:MAG: Sensor histidine kinase RcsC [Ignavibacteriaceae bacterium]|nr:Sensor histidine kinase RcsC [Ignavibacteriaceae bacterium]